MSSMVQDTANQPPAEHSDDLLYFEEGELVGEFSGQREDHVYQCGDCFGVGGRRYQILCKNHACARGFM